MKYQILNTNYWKYKINILEIKFDKPLETLVREQKNAYGLEEYRMLKWMQTQFFITRSTELRQMCHLRNW